MPMTSRLVAGSLVLTSLAMLGPAPAAAQGPGGPPLPTTVVMVNLTVKPDVDRALLAKAMPAEIRDTVQAYLDGNIQQWFGRSDGRGVMFLVNASSVAEAKAMMDTLPLAKLGLADFDYTPLGPLGPMRLLLVPAAPPAKGPQ